MNSEADSLYEEACAHYENEEIDSCTYKLTKALELYRKSGENEKVAITCLSLGQSYNGIAQTDSARPYLLEGLKYCEENTVLAKSVSNLPRILSSTVFSSQYFSPSSK